jgi:hypothetical protein
MFILTNTDFGVLFMLFIFFSCVVDYIRIKDGTRKPPIGGNDWKSDENPWLS